MAGMLEALDFLVKVNYVLSAVGHVLGHPTLEPGDFALMLQRTGD